MILFRGPAINAGFPDGWYNIEASSRRRKAMSCAALADANAAMVWLRPIVDGCEVKVDGKDEAVRLRQRLVRLGVHCTFPIPTWQGAQFVLHASYPPGTSYTEFERLVLGIDGVQLMRNKP
jgi:hypothetical protein